MVRAAEGECCTQSVEERFPELTHKNFVTITNYSLGGSMKVVNFCNENWGKGGSCKISWQGYEVSEFSEAINNDPNDSFIGGGGKMCDEIHRDVFPYLTRNR